MGRGHLVPTIFSSVLALVVENRFYAFDRAGDQLVFGRGITLVTVRSAK
jgi:hypothetical protein